MVNSHENFDHLSTYDLTSWLDLQYTFIENLPIQDSKNEPKLESNESTKYSTWLYIADARAIIGDVIIFIK